MVVAFLLLYFGNTIDLMFHELAGLFIFILVIIHYIINIKWIKAIRKRFFSKNLPLKTKLRYVTSMILTTLFTLLVVSGILTSQELFPFSFNDKPWHPIHHFCAEVSLVAVCVHVGLNWSFVKKVFKSSSSSHGSSKSHLDTSDFNNSEISKSFQNQATHKTSKHSLLDQEGDKKWTSRSSDSQETCSFSTK